MELTKLKRQRAVDAVYKAIRRAILDGMFKAGERLDIPQLASRLGVSFTPVRHAIQMLTTEGLVRNKPRSGTFVASVSERDITDTFDIRCALECLASETAVSRITPRQLARIRELLEILKKPIVSARTRKRHEAANAELHHILVEAAGNRRLSAIYATLNAYVIISRLHCNYDYQASRFQEEQEEHAKIVENLERGNVARLQSILRKHIHRAKNALVSDLTQPVK
jgi:DNA-binding GntR family transcriptional regulator